MVVETFASSPFDRLMLLLAGEYFTEFSRRESFKLLITSVKIRKMGKMLRVQDVICPLVTTFSADNWKARYVYYVSPLTPKDLQRRRAMSPLNIKIPSKKSRQAALRGGI
jgi:hypothetical protein